MSSGKPASTDDVVLDKTLLGITLVEAVLTGNDDTLAFIDETISPAEKMSHLFHLSNFLLSLLSEQVEKTDIETLTALRESILEGDEN